MGGNVDAHVIPRGEECGHQHHRPIGGHGFEHILRCGAEDVDERDLHPVPELFGHPLGEIGDHRDPAGFAGAVRHQQQAHNAPAISVFSSVSSTANR